MSQPPLESLEVRVIRPERVAVLRHVGPYTEISATFRKLMTWALPRGLVGPQTRLLALYYDNPEVVPAEQLRSDAGVPIPDNYEPDGPVTAVTIEGGEYIVATFLGPYDQLSAVYQYLRGTWLKEHKRRLRGAPLWERYLNDPTEVPPEQLRTEIYLPLEDASSPAAAGV